MKYNSMKPYVFLKFFLLAYLMGVQVIGWGQCSNGDCVFIHGELKSSYTFNYSATVINDQPKRTYAGSELVDADFSRKNGILKVNLYGLQVEGTASKQKVFIRTKQVWISSGSEFKKPDDIKLLPVGDRASIELKFQAIANSKDSRGQIRVEFTAVIDGNEIQFTSNKRPYFIINYDFKSYKESGDPSPIGKSDLIRDQLANLDIVVNNKKADKSPQWFLPYLEAYEGTSEPKFKNPLEDRLKVCCKELYEASNTQAELKEFIRLYDVENRLNCEAYGSFISKAYEKLEMIPKDKPILETPKPADPPTNASSVDPENLGWRRAIKTGTIHEYENYRRKFPRGKHYEEATEAIKKIERLDKQAFDELLAKLNQTDDAEEKKSICREYLRKQPDVNYRLCHELANKIMTELSTFFARLQQPQPGGVDFLLIVKSPKLLDPLVEVSYNGIELTNDVLETSDWKKAGGDNTYEKKYKYLEPGDYTFKLKFQDASFKEEKFKINSSLPPTIRVNGDVLRIIGGIPPFKIYYSTDDNDPTASQQLKISDEANLQQRLFDVKEIFKTINYKRLIYYVVDDDEEIIGDKQTINTKIDWLPRLFLVLGILIISGIVGAIMYLNKERVYTWMAKQPILLTQFKWLEAYKKSIKKAPPVSTPDVTIAVLSTEKASVKIKDPKEVGKEPTIGIKIKTPEVKGGIAADASPMLFERGYTSVEPLGDSSFFSFELDELWLNTVVSKVYIHRRCVADIEIEVNNYLMKCVADSVAKPEVGGFLMGKYGQYSDGRYFVVFYDYIKAHTTAHDEYEVELAMEDLDDPLRAVPDYGLMGWFHTHPGHTVFLSGRDLNIQKTHFNRPYQIAMETDPVSSNYDLSFFTWQNGGGLNEGASSRTTSAWLSWKTLNDWVRAIR